MRVPFSRKIQATRKGLVSCRAWASRVSRIASKLGTFWVLTPIPISAASARTLEKKAASSASSLPSSVKMTRGWFVSRAPAVRAGFANASANTSVIDRRRFSTWQEYPGSGRGPSYGPTETSPTHEFQESGTILGTPHPGAR